MLARGVRLMVVGLCAVLAGGCAINTSLIGSFGEDAPDRAAVREAKKPDNAAEPSLSDRLSALWRQATTSGDDDEALETVAPAETLKPEEALALVNSYRESEGLPPLKLHPKLREAALAHAQDLAENDRISHFGSDGSDAWERVRRTGFDPRVTAENVGAGQATFGELLREWKRSPSHKRNLLLPDATHMGVAVVTKPATQFNTFWSLVVGASG
jgi:uncharacterized protein YkwD